MPTKPVTLRLPEELLAAIDEIVASTDTNRTEVVVKALQQVFSGEADQPTPTTTPETTATPATTPDTTLLKRLEELEVKISSVMDRLDSDVLSRLTKRVSVLEEGLSSSEPPTPVEKTPRTTKTATSGQKRTTTVKETKASKASKEPPEPPASKEPPEPPASKEPAEPPASKQSKTKTTTKTTNGRRRQAKAEKKLPAAKETSKTKTIAPPPPAEEPTPTKRRTRAKSTPEVTTKTPAATKNKRGTIEWLTVKEAFEKLGGDASDPESIISSIDGDRTVKLNRFRVLSASDYQAFGLEFRPDRRRRRLPCLRKL